MINLVDYIYQSNLFQTIEIDDLLAVKYECFINDERSDIWSHTNYFAFVENGKKKWKTANNEVLAHPGDMLFVRKGTQTVYQYFDEPFYVVFIFIDDQYIKNTVLEFKSEASLQVVREDHKEDLILLERNDLIDSYRTSFNSLFAKDVKLTSPLLKLKIKELILSLLTQTGNEQFKSFVLSLSADKYVLLEQTMNANFHRPLSIQDFARLCTRSLSAFRRDFEHVFKTTPGKWLIERRIAYSRILLESTDKPINEVADLCGFKNRSHFLKRFRDQYHVSPRKYREVSKIAL